MSYPGRLRHAESGADARLRYTDVRRIRSPGAASNKGGGGQCEQGANLTTKQMILVVRRALQWSGNPHGNGYGVEMDRNGAQFVKMLWIGLDLGEGHQLESM